MAKLESLEKSLEELKKEKETDDKTISDALNSLSEDVEKVAGALLKKVSKQDS